jgi:5,10-methylenetetrahydrofolate reductase
MTQPFLEALRSPGGASVVELRPPSLGLTGPQAMEAWIDLHHQVRRLVRAGHYLFLTDNAVGTAEEENLAHLGANLAEEVDPARVIPFLTAKHTLDYCLLYAERAWAQGFRALVVLGGDRSLGPNRCVPHAYELRARIRERVPELVLGGWANPHRDPVEQARYLADPAFGADFWLSQVVSHHSAHRVAALAREVRAAGVQAPGVFGVFFYRSPAPRTLERLGEFFPVPAQELAREFEAGATPEEICVRTVRALREAGARNLYFSNLALGSASRTLGRILP